MSDEYIIYPVPLSSGVATIKLPFNFTKEDAEKVARVVMSLANNTPAVTSQERNDG